jgi:hypothetical protein
LAVSFIFAIIPRVFNTLKGGRPPAGGALFPLSPKGGSLHNANVYESETHLHP